MQAPSETTVRVALLVQQQRDEGLSDVQAVHTVADALGVSSAAVAHCVKVVSES